MEGLLAIGKHTFIHTYIHTYIQVSMENKYFIYIYIYIGSLQVDFRVEQCSIH